MNSRTFKNIKVLVLTEIRYNLPFLFGLGVFFIGYTIISVFDMQLFTRSLQDIDFWGGLFAFFYYLLIYVMWMVRIKEKRLRLHSTLPVSQGVIGASRMVFIASVITLSFVYITILLIAVPSWSEESGSILAQLGFVFIVFALFIIGRDIWYLDSAKRSGNIVSMIIIEMIIISLTALIFIYARPFLYDISGAYAGRAVFIIWAFLLTILTSVTLKKRKQFLA